MIFKRVAFSAFNNTRVRQHHAYGAGVDQFAYIATYKNIYLLTLKYANNLLKGPGDEDLTRYSDQADTAILYGKGGLAIGMPWLGVICSRV